MARLRIITVAHPIRLLLLIAGIQFASTLTCPKSSGSSPGRELVCHTSSYDLESLESAICHCTTLIHTGHDLASLDASDVSSLRAAAKKANRRIRVLLSVNDEHRILKKSANIPDVVTSLTKTMQEVDGLELNVTAGNKLKLVSFLRTLKDEMVNKDLEKKIFLVLPTKPEHLAKKFELKELSKYVDLFTIPTHYLKDNDQVHRTFHPSRLMGLFDMLNTDSLVDLVHGMGAPKQKILISAPVSAYHFRLQDPANNIPRSHALDEEPESYDRQKLCNVMSKGEWTVERDEDLTGPYAFKNTTWIAFEDETSLKIKGKYVILRDLAGLALRDVESDRKNTCGAPLVVSVHQAMTEMKRKPRDAVFSSLEKDLKGSSSRYPRQVRTSDFRIVRVVDTEGNVQAVRENTQTAFTCTRQGYFTHPKSCNRFYRCVKFNQAVDDYSVFEFDCPEGLAFDEKTEICAWPGSLSKGSACPGSSEIEPVPRTRFRCPSHPGFYADPHNCRWFFACYDLGGPEMVPYEFRCPFGLVFDQSKLVCEWPWKVPGCNGPGHGDGSYTQNFGGYNQDSGIPQGGIVGLGGFVGQSGYSGQSPEGLGAYDNPNQAYNYDYSNYQGGSSSLANNAGFGPSSQNYNPSGSFAGPSSYNGQPQYIASNANGYPGQAPQNFAGPQPSQGVQNSYNQGNSGSSYTPFVFYNYDNEPAKSYNGQSGSYPNSNSDYDSQKYNNPDSSATYNGQSYAGPRPNDQYPTYYDQQPVYPGKNNQNVPNYNNQIYNNNNGNKNPANAKPEKFDDNAAKSNGKPAKNDYDSTSFTANAPDYDDQRGTNFNNGITSQTSIYANNGIQTTQVNSEKFATTAGLENYAGTTQNPVNYQTNSPDTFKTTNSAADYFDSQRINGATSTYGGPGKDEGFKDATGINNYAGNSAADYNTNAGRVTTAGIVPANNAASTISPSKLEDDSVQTDVYKNSDVFGQTTLGFNNEITKFSQTTKIPQDFGLSGTTSVDESFRTNYASNTQYDQGTTIGRNPFAGFGGVTPAGPSATPGRIEQDYNAKDSTIPGVVPLNNQKTEGPNDFGSYKTNYAGFTTSYTKSEEDSGYKTNEYHDNGGRGTIRYNNGVVTSKVTQGYNTSPFTERTNSFNNNNFNKQSTLSPLDGQNNNDLKQFTEGVYTKGGFTKTGPTKTGITTAQVGGSGSYIIGTGTPRQRPDPAYIGEHAFTGSSAASKPGFNSDIVRTTPTPFADATGTTYGNAKFEENSGFTKSPNNYNNVGSPYNPAKPNEKYPANEYSRDDTKSNDKNGFKGYSYPAPAYNDKSKGYSYPKPVVELETADLSNANPEPTQNKYFDGTTAYPFSGNQPSKFNAENYGTTARPLAFTTDQMENFRTTVYQAAKIAQETSTLKPVIDNGYKSVILSTPVPAVISTQSYQSDEITTREQTYLDVGVTFGQNDYYNQDNSDYPDTFTTSNQGSFGQRIVTQTDLAQTQFYQSTQNPQVFNQNNELRPFPQKNNFPVPNKGQQNFRPENQPFSPKTVVPLPKQVYVSPKAVTPAVGVTYANPIVAADSRQRQPNQETTPSLSTITDPPVSVQKGLNYRILQQRPANEVANNQVQGYYGSQTGLNGGSRNQAPTGFVPQAYSQTFYNSEGQTDFNQQRYNNVRVNNQNPPSYVHQTSSTGYSDSRYGQNSALYRTQDGSTSNAESSQSFYNQNTGNSVSGQGQGFSGQTRTLIGSNVITSIGSFNSENSNQNGANAGEQRILAEFNNVNSKKSQQSTTSAPEITTFGGQYGSTQTTRTKANEASSSRDENKKVVVKLSDLHPLILGKLNAECTCKADPFALLRGPDRQSLPVNSQNRGRVDLANYDESDIYVDLDGDQRSQAETEFVRNLPLSQVLSSSRVQFKSGTRDRNGGLKGPAPGYLPAAAPSKEYLPSTTAPEFTPITEEDSDANSYPRSLFVKVDNVGSASYTRSRTGKALVSGAPVNNVKTQNELVKSLKNREDAVGLECARPGLFRHPKQCNKFYACHWDEWKRRYTLHVFNCPVHLAFDSSAGACNFPSKGPACQDNKLLL